MSDELLTRLRGENPDGECGYCTNAIDAAHRIEFLEAALQAADELAQSAHNTIHDDADTSLVDALTAYRKARGGET